MADKSHAAYTFEDVQRIAENVLSNTKHRPKLGIVCGTGLGDLANSVTDANTIPYTSIPGFPVSTVQGHQGSLVFGLLRGKPVVLMQGRFHYYEGYPMWKVAMPIRVMKALGVSTVILTNAAGGLNQDYKTGDLMLIRDHIDLPGLTGECVLVGKNDERFGPRFLGTADIYDNDLRALAKQIGSELGFSGFLREGTYLMIGGPTYETVAECRMLRAWGADAVGMSTVPEAIVAHHGGMKVFGISIITDMTPMDYDFHSTVSHKEVLAVGERRAKDVHKLVSTLVERLDIK